MKLLIYSTVILVGILASCKKKETPCETINITTVKKNSNIGINNGSIKVTSPKGNYTYSINGTTFQSDSLFNNLGIGNYTVTVKNATNCTATVNVALTDICSGAPVFVATTKVDAITGQTNGSITVTSPIGTGVTYSINGGAYQASTNFNNLAGGNYTIAVKTDLGCAGSTTVSITNYGPKYYLVKNIIKGYCGPCHLNGATDGGVNWDTDANIVAKWDRIKIRAVDNLPTVMPVSGPLTASDKLKITDWVNAGHTVNN
jgi:hypothetical protein